MTKQEIFEQVAKHLIKQNKKALNANGDCSYKTEEGLRCAIGCLIPNGHKGLELDGTIYDLLEDFPDLEELIAPSDLEEEKSYCFLEDLQEIHDFDDPTEWPYKLKNCAFKYNLTIPDFIKEINND